MSAHTGGITPLRKLTQPAISTNYCCHEHAEEIFKTFDGKLFFN